MNRFTLPRDIYYGKDSLEVLKTLSLVGAGTSSLVVS